MAPSRRIEHTENTAAEAAPRAPLGRPFLTIWAGQTLSEIGSMLSGVGVGVFVFLETGSAAWLGAIVAMAALPTVVLMPLMRHVDRLPRRRVMIGADSIAAIGSIAVLTLASSGQLQTWHLAAAAFVGGVGVAFQVPAMQASIPSLVDAEAISRANGLTQFGPAVGITIGPLLAAPIVGWWGLQGVIAIDLATFAIAVASTIATPFDDTATPTESDDGSWLAARSWLTGPGRPLITLIGVMAAVNLVMAGFNVALFALAVQIGGTSLAGVPLAVGGVAMIAGSVVLGTTALPAKRIRVFALALALVGLGCWIAALRPSIVALSIGVAIGLASVPAVNAAVSTIFHERVPESMQGRVFAVRGAIGQSLGPIGSMLAGFIITAIAEPAMRADAWGGRTAGRVIGTGTERGSALMLIGIGLALVLLAVRLSTSKVAAELDARRPVRPPADADAATPATPTSAPATPAPASGRMRRPTPH